MGSTAPTGGAVSALTQHPATEVRSAEALTWTPAIVPVTSACTVSPLHPGVLLSLPGLARPCPREVVAKGSVPCHRLHPLFKAQDLGEPHP